MKSFLQAAASALTGLSIFAALSAPAFAQRASDPRAHMNLARAVEEVGVRVIVNPAYCHKDHGEGTLYGFYSGSHKVLVICPEEAELGQRDPIWTEEDYDTLRHEVVHLLQDCQDGKLDGELDAFTVDPQRVGLELLGPEAMARIQAVYLKRGKDQHIVRMEWEAFGLASLNVPEAQEAALRNECRLVK